MTAVTHMEVQETQEAPGDVISVRGFRKSYGDVQAVDLLDFTVRRGELFGLIGPDGAGKTTTMRSIVTLLRPDGGSISVNGLDAASQQSAIRAITGYMPQRFSLYPDLSVEQNLRFFADLFGVDRTALPERLERLYRFSRLEEFRHRLAGRLSGGMKQKLALSCTLIHDPILLVLDEPTTGVDPVSRREFWDILRMLREQGVSILVSTPYMDEAAYCDRIIVMHEGRALAEGRPEDLPTRITDTMYALEEQALVMDYDRIEALDAVRSVQSFGDSLHITTDPSAATETLESSIAAVAGHPVTLRRIEPSLEDVFITLIAEGTKHD